MTGVDASRRGNDGRPCLPSPLSPIAPGASWPHRSAGCWWRRRSRRGAGGPSRSWVWPSGIGSWPAGQPALGSGIRSSSGWPGWRRRCCGCGTSRARGTSSQSRCSRPTSVSPGLLVPATSARPWVRWLAVPGALVLCEAARWSFPFEGVPLATVAMSQADAPLAQVARWVAPSAWCWSWESVGWPCRRRGTGTGGPPGVAVAVVALVWATSMVVPMGSDVAELSRGLRAGWRPPGHPGHDTDPQGLRSPPRGQRGGRDAVDLVLWPENVVAVEARSRRAREHRELRGSPAGSTPRCGGRAEGMDGERFTNFQWSATPTAIWATATTRCYVCPSVSTCPSAACSSGSPDTPGSAPVTPSSAPRLRCSHRRRHRWGRDLVGGLLHPSRREGVAGGWGDHPQPDQRLLVLATQVQTQQVAS